MKFCALASGSSGNSYYLEHEGAGLLIDCGIAAKAIAQAVTAAGGAMERVRAVLITHEHIDHIKSAGTIARRYGIPLYATSGTWRGMAAKIGAINDDLAQVLPSGGQAVIGGFDIQWVRANHDANEPVCYTVTAGGQKIGIATDTGVLNLAILDRLYNSRLLVVEANHDEEMLRCGRYPYPLKKRIAGDCGHLSNSDCGRGLLELIGPDTRFVQLAHLSQENNLPAVAYHCVKNILLNGRLKGRLNLSVASRAQSPVLELSMLSH